MDAGTCARESVEDGLRNIDSRVQELMNSHYHLHASVMELGDKFGQLQTTMDLVLREFQQSVKGKGVASSPDIPIGSSSPIIHHNNGETGNSFSRNPRFQFPIFNGEDIKNWIRKTGYFFQFNPMNDEQKLRSVALNLEGEAGTWFLAYFKSHPTISWKQFLLEVEIRFSETSFDKALSEFNRLQQTSSVLQYQKRFELLRSLVEAENPGLEEAYFVKYFIGGLKEEISEFVSLLKPPKLTQAIAAARVKESIVEAIYKRNQTNVLGYKQGGVSMTGSNSSQFLGFGIKSIPTTSQGTQGSSAIIANKPAVSKMFNGPMTGEYCKDYMFQYESNNGVFTGSVTLVDEFTLQINGRKIKVASTRKLEEIPWADYRTHYMAVTGAKKLNAPMESEDKMKEVWDSNNSKNGRNSNWTDFERVENIEAYDVNVVGVHVTFIENPFEILFGQKQVFFWLHNSPHMEMELLLQMTFNWDGLYSMQWLSISDEAIFIFDPGGLRWNISRPIFFFFNP